ncbi:hypothetical protein R70006_06221 [Paraburkholderia domus]|uniref:hypothetical protein n=1 Tax=Paraburkholderia domus TaxID=2793075 RepID=UPI00191201E4|nr:hypothetical protein [Paraburkholderia domus]MBK5052852.1 hypothetical protein [Burkholderia sp. R-70006]CAE6821500.1 hypothetical protein R70006_06221 [Paraburkholderia domus]
MGRPVKIPDEVRSRLIDVDVDPDTASAERVAEECQYLAQMLREGGSNYDDSSASERRAMQRQCDAYLKAHAAATGQPAPAARPKKKRASSRYDPVSLRERLFNDDGTITGMSYSSASGKRGAVLSVSTTRPGKKRLATSLLVDGRDFPEVFAVAVQLIADFHDVPSDDPLRVDMLASKAAFLAAKELTTRRVVIEYDQVSLVDSESAGNA